MTQKNYWRSFNELAQTREFRTRQANEFPTGGDEIEMSGVSRRAFMGIMGASAALASTAACVRKPTQYILPYTSRPEDLIPGEARYFATSMTVAGSVLGLLVASQDGRPTKLEGNPRHPASMGTTDVWAQAEILRMYDPARSQTALHNGEAASWSALSEGLAGLNVGGDAAILVEDNNSPTVNALLEQLAAGGAKVYSHDLTGAGNRTAAHKSAGAGNASTVYSLEGVSRIVSLDSDFLGTGADHVRLAREFANGRRLESENDEMNRLYAVEPAFTVTGSSADNRLQISASMVGEFTKALANKLVEGGASAPGLGGYSVTSGGENFDQWVDQVATDLLAARGSSLVIAGERQPAWVHGLALAMNQALQNIGTSVKFLSPATNIEIGSLAELAASITAGQTKKLIIIGANPVYTAPADMDFAGLLGQLEASVHLGFYQDETAKAASWHIPMSHQLEAWGDTMDSSGNAAIQQPAIDPLYNSWSPVELLANIIGVANLANGFDSADGEALGGYAQVRRFWRNKLATLTFDGQWRAGLHSGFMGNYGAEVNTNLTFARFNAEITSGSAPTTSALEAVFALDYKALDGRYSNNAWMQELAEPITKLTWDNAVLIGPKTAQALGIEFDNSVDPDDSEELAASDEFIPSTLEGGLRVNMATVTVDGRSLDLPILVTPGVADNTIILPLGYGRQGLGPVADGVGFNTFSLLGNSGWIAPGASLTKKSELYDIATTQDHGSMEGRPLVREATKQAYNENPDFVLDSEIMPADKLNSLWEEPNARDGQQWGMSIDLSTCIGCSACTIACQAENNISVVGKERILDGREMAWIRIDRYYSGTPENPEAAMQPVGCMHCENAPCEQVCPVAATVHGPEGTNDMAYNRCIGTRYCANNCPFKVRRFNFFNFSRENDEGNALLRLQRNSNVTVRFRGVMEKCTYCIQRVNAAKIDAKVNGSGVVQDGAITPACGQACPTQAIVFGDINDPNSAVSRAKARNRDYAVLAWLNIHPRTTYLAKIRNPNPALA